jgi:hypothetical protein
MLVEVAGLLAPILGWSGEEAAGEVARTVRILESVHGVSPAQMNRASVYH